MKTYCFPIGGTQGKHEYWDGAMDIAISDKDAIRLEASARKAKGLHFDEDPAVQDIYERVRKKIIREQTEELKNIGRLEELREFNPEWSDDDLVDEEMGFWSIGYPEELVGTEERVEE